MYAHVKPKSGLDGSLFKSENLSIDSRILGIDSNLEGEGGKKPFYRLKDCGIMEDYSDINKQSIPIIEPTLNLE
jgi:hypothetical protein